MVDYQGIKEPPRSVAAMQADRSGKLPFFSIFDYGGDRTEVTFFVTAGVHNVQLWHLAPGCHPPFYFFPFDTAPPPYYYITVRD